MGFLARRDRAMVIVVWVRAASREMGEGATNKNPARISGREQRDFKSWMGRDTNCQRALMTSRSRWKDQMEISDGRAEFTEFVSEPCNSRDSKCGSNFGYGEPIIGAH